MSIPWTIEATFHVDRAKRGRKILANGAAPPPLPPGRVPRVARLLALAHRLEGLVRSGAVKDYAELARVGHVTRARISQILSLLLLAPDIQEAVLFLPATERGRDLLRLRQLLDIAAAIDWPTQRQHWQNLLKSVSNRLASAADTR